MPETKNANEHARLVSLVADNLRKATGLRFNTATQELSLYVRDEDGERPIDLNYDPRSGEKFSVHCFESALDVFLLLAEVVIGIRLVRKHHVGDPIWHYVRADKRDETTDRRAVPKAILDRASGDTDKTNTPPPEVALDPIHPGRYHGGDKPDKK
jgi:hypothetical protein